MLVPRGQILFIDAYDSFSQNIVSLLETTLDVSVRTVKIDDKSFCSDEILHLELSHYLAVVCGPGPGHPADEHDAGLMRKIWRLSDEFMLPVLGICLGFQGLCLEFGAEIRRLDGPQHGMIRRITHAGQHEPYGSSTIYQGVGDLKATLYHSLCAEIGVYWTDDSTWEKNRWEPTTSCPDLIPLAWAELKHAEPNSGAKDDKILMAVEHATKPFAALQYHPESICTDEESNKVIKNWFTKAMIWNMEKRSQQVSLTGAVLSQSATRESLLHRAKIAQAKKTPFRWDGLHSLKSFLSSVMGLTTLEYFHTVYDFRTIKLPENIEVPDILEAAQSIYGENIVFESSNANQSLPSGAVDVRGSHSIIGLDLNECLKFTYYAPDKTFYVQSEYTLARLNPELYGGVWPFLAYMLDHGHIEDGNDRSPFWGGLLGYTTYEMGLQGINVAGTHGPGSAKLGRPDLSFAWVTKSLVVDHAKGVIYLQKLQRKDDRAKPFNLDTWAAKLTQDLERISDSKKLESVDADSLDIDSKNTESDDTEMDTTSMMTESMYKISMDTASRSTDAEGTKTKVMETKDTENESTEPHCVDKQDWVVDEIISPADATYENKVLNCQEFIGQGNSYELCLTGQTAVSIVTRMPSSKFRGMPTKDADGLDIDRNKQKVRTATSFTAWPLYKKLRTRQPAPFASYIRLGGATLVSSSPERFLKWDSTGACELRPMKGTVKKSPNISTLAQAIPLLDVPKEKAENLMIVDLVRHDLHGVCGSSNVSVPRLMVVEEYASVFQMISIVQGQIPPAVDNNLESHLPAVEVLRAKGTRHTGIDVLAASLPPGSMTGAPKKRSCEILLGIEEDVPRSLYSGVVGYMDVGGRGDFSVTIRSMFRWDDESKISAAEAGPERADSASGVEALVRETWRIGAGGAVTTLSTAVGEREEMQTKLSGTLGLFK